MSDHLPPLAALRAFEAAARLENFSRAADEIHVTHGAVSHQVRALEDFVGRPLFTRQGRGVILNSDGRALAAAIRTALAQIADAARTIRRRTQSNRLSISTLPSFGSRWLMPRIVRFMGDHPGWAINIDSTPDLVDFSRDDTDIALRFGNGDWPGVHAEWLMDDEYILVASPRLNRGRLPKKPARLIDFPLMRADAEPWKAWCEAAGIDIALPASGIGYEDMGVMLQGAIDGQGITLTRRAIAEIELEKGTLVQLFDIATPAGASYWIVLPEERPVSEQAAAFRDWLLEEATSARAKSRRPKTRAPRIG
jgi:LysR family glycine cleavage system transcriptional activator